MVSPFLFCRSISAPRRSSRSTIRSLPPWADDVRTVLQQQVHHSLATEVGGSVERCEAETVLQVDVGATLQEELDSLHVLVLSVRSRLQDVLWDFTTRRAASRRRRRAERGGGAGGRGRHEDRLAPAAISFLCEKVMWFCIVKGAFTAEMICQQYT